MTTGLINLLKPPGMTSHDAVSFIRRIYRQKKVGHSGTLDPAATGLLVVVLGKFTKLSQKFSGEDKAYDTKDHVAALRRLNVGATSWL